MKLELVTNTNGTTSYLVTVTALNGKRAIIETADWLDAWRLGYQFALENA